MPHETTQTRDMHTIITDLAIAHSAITYWDRETSECADKLAAAVETDDMRRATIRARQFRNAQAETRRHRATFADVAARARREWRDEILVDALTDYVAQSGDRYVRRALRRLNDLLANDVDDPYIPA